MFFLTRSLLHQHGGDRVVYCLWRLRWLRTLVLLCFGVLTNLKKLMWQMPLAHVWFSHKSPSGNGERSLEAIASSGNEHSLSSCLHCYFLNFWAEIPHAFPDQPHTKLQPLFSWEHHVSGLDCLLWTLTINRRRSSQKWPPFPWGKMATIRESHRIILRFCFCFCWLCWALVMTYKVFPVAFGLQRAQPQ